MKKLSDEFVIAVGLLLISFFIFQTAIMPTLFREDLAAAVSTSVKNDYSMQLSKTNPGAFTFNYKFAVTSAVLKGERYFDASIAAFDEKKVPFEIGEQLGPIRDAWGYPVRENAFMKKTAARQKTSFNFFETKKALAYDADPNNPGIYNCRANLNVTGYFKAYFEDVALDTNVGYDDPTFGQGRRIEACQVLQDISEMIKLDEMTVTPDILFMANANMPPGALAAASAYFGYYQGDLDNGSLHKHIISQTDPTPGQGNFDALIMTGWNGVQWDVDSTLNPLTYDFYTVIYHEVMHTLGFRGRLPSVVSETGVPRTHGTFDFFSYKDDTLSDSFFDQVTSILNVPVGAPPSWFIGNTVVYRGIKNVVGAIPDGIRPVFSPVSWQQGSSLSHFDMNRAPGEIYVMHPSIGTNTVRPIDDHEKEVLCHAGYQMDGVAGCELETPVAENDSFNLNGNPVCIKPLLNDISLGGGVLSIHHLTPILLETGDSFAYYLGANCTGTLLPNALGAKSIMFDPSPSMNPRLFAYSNQDSISNRISLEATIKSASECIGLGDPDEYVCNGDFEMPLMTPLGQNGFLCQWGWDANDDVPNWCHLIGSVDVVSAAQPGSYFRFPWSCGFFSGCSVQMSPGSSRHAHMYRSKTLDNFQAVEGIITKLKYPTVANQAYQISFDVVSVSSPQTPNVKIIARLGNNSSLASPNLPNSIIQNVPSAGQQILEQNIITNDPNNNWQHIEQIFYADGAYEYFSVYPDFVTPTTCSACGAYNYVDNISIRKYEQTDNKISGAVYQDLNQNGGQDASDPGLDGVQVSIYKQGQTTPLSTVTTSNIPNLGLYEFTSLPDDSYYVVVADEALYQNVTEPVQNNGLLPGYSHPYSITVTGGQTDPDNDFGVVLDSTTPPNEELPPVDIKVVKDLIDPTLSVFDRYVTWRVRVANLGPNAATNIVVNDVFPAGLMYGSHQSLNPQNTFNPVTGVFSIHDLAPGAQTHIDITLKVPKNACGVKTNVANLISLDQDDTSSNNDQGSASLTLKPCVIQHTSTPK